MAGANSYPEGTTALAFDSEQRSLVKINSQLNAGGGGGGGTASGNVIHIAGSGAPGSAPASGTGIAYNDSGNEFIYTSLGWEQIL